MSVTDPFTAIAINGLIQLAGAAAVRVAFLVGDRRGRRPTLLAGISTMAVANAVLMLTFGLGPSPVLAFTVLALFSLFFIYRLAPEIRGRQLEPIRSYWYNSGRWPEEAKPRV